MSLHIHKPVKPLHGTVYVSGSKSISNRLLVLGAISGQSPQLINLSDAEDTRLLKKALDAIVTVNPPMIDVNHAGTDFRFLTALLSIMPGQRILTGSQRLQQRPVGELVNALRQLGADIRYTGREGYPPLQINGKQLEGGTVHIAGTISSQFVSALLLIAPALPKGLDLYITGDPVSWPYTKMTIDLLREFGVQVSATKQRISVPHHILKHGAPSYTVESDWSSASYWYSMVALAGEADIYLEHYAHSSLQADSVLPTVYNQLGVHTDYTAGGLRLRKQIVAVSGFDYDFTECPDIAQTVAVTCLGLGIKARLNGLKTLKIKETDRILAMKQELEKFGAQVHVTDHSITMVPPEQLTMPPDILINTYHDHRMALSFIPLSLKQGSICIDKKTVVEKSYPRIWNDLENMGFRLS